MPDPLDVGPLYDNTIILVSRQFAQDAFACEIMRGPVPYYQRMYVPAGFVYGEAPSEDEKAPIIGCTTLQKAAPYVSPLRYMNAMNDPYHSADPLTLKAAVNFWRIPTNYQGLQSNCEVNEVAALSFLIQTLCNQGIYV